MYKELNDTKQDSDDQTFYSCMTYDPSLFYSFCTKSQLEPVFLERIEMLRLSTNCHGCALQMNTSFLLKPYLVF